MRKFVMIWIISMLISVGFITMLFHDFMLGLALWLFGLGTFLFYRVESMD